MAIAYDNFSAAEAVQHVRVERLLLEVHDRLRAPQPCLFKKWPPDYDAVHVWRRRQLGKFEVDPSLVVKAKAYYKDNFIAFCNHWCDTWDPRNASIGKPVRMPFIFFPRQVQLAQFFLECLRDQKPGLVEKSRDMGATYEAVALSVWLFLFKPGAVIGWGSATQPKLDQIGDPSSIFEKIRLMLMHLPDCFLPEDFKDGEYLNFMRCVNPENGAAIIGEIGDNIGRGARTMIYWKDEAAHYVRPEKIEASLSDTTRCPIDISSVNGLGNVFHRRREAGTDWSPGLKIPTGTRVFVLDWRDHPEKTQKWYDERRTDAEANGLLHVFAQEVDRSYSAAVQGVMIPAEWVQAAIDAHKVLKIPDGGPWGAGLDVADSGHDRNALIKRQGIVVRSADEWGERDVGVTARRTIGACEGLGRIEIQYDAIGIGAGVKAEANRLKDDKLMPKGIVLIAWNAGDSVLNPASRVVEDDNDSPRNKDFYQNLKAQGWWELRMRFYRTWQAVTQNVKHHPDSLISLDSTLPLLRKIEKELSQATASKSSRLKLVVDKTPEGTRSPNLADAIVMAFWPLPQYDQMTIGLGAAVFVGGERFEPV